MVSLGEDVLAEPDQVQPPISAERALPEGAIVEVETVDIDSRAIR